MRAPSVCCEHGGPGEEGESGTCPFLGRLAPCSPQVEPLGALLPGRGPGHCPREGVCLFAALCSLKRGHLDLGLRPLPVPLAFLPPPPSSLENCGPQLCALGRDRGTRSPCRFLFSVRWSEVLLENTLGAQREKSRSEWRWTRVRTARGPRPSLEHPGLPGAGFLLAPGDKGHLAVRAGAGRHRSAWSSCGCAGRGLAPERPPPLLLPPLWPWRLCRARHRQP